MTESLQELLENVTNICDILLGEYIPFRDVEHSGISSRPGIDSADSGTKFNHTIIRFRNHLHFDLNSTYYEEISSRSMSMFIFWVTFTYLTFLINLDNMNNFYQTTTNDNFLNSMSGYDEQNRLRPLSVSPNSTVLPSIQNTRSINDETACTKKTT